MKSMPFDVEMKLKPLLVNSRFGRINTEEQQDFIFVCWKTYPEDYKALHEEVVKDSIKVINPMLGGN